MDSFAEWVAELIERLAEWFERRKN